MACQVQSGPDPGLLGAQARDSVCLLEIKLLPLASLKGNMFKTTERFFSVKDWSFLLKTYFSLCLNDLIKFVSSGGS